MRLQTLGSLCSLLWLGASCSTSDKETSVTATQAAQQQHDKAIRDTATVPGFHTLIISAYKHEEYAQARADLALLGRRYPHAKVYAQLEPLKGRLDSLAAAQQRRETTRRQRQGLAGTAALTSWQVAEYPDEFNKPSGRFYLTNADIQRGTFSTAAATDAPLVARLLADSSATLHLVLYDYVPTVAHTTPTGRKHHLHHHRPAATVTTYTYSTSYAEMRPLNVLSPNAYTVKVRGNNGQIYTLKAINAHDQLTFNPADAKTLHECLLQGGEVSFAITTDAMPATNYRFTLANADGYEAAYHRLLLKR